MYICWAIERILLVTQYNTSPDGNQRKNTVNTIGSICIILAWIGSAGGGLSLC